MDPGSRGLKRYKDPWGTPCRTILTDTTGSSRTESCATRCRSWLICEQPSRQSRTRHSFWLAGQYKGNGGSLTSVSEHILHRVCLCNVFAVFADHDAELALIVCRRDRLLLEREFRHDDGVGVRRRQRRRRFEKHDRDLWNRQVALFGMLLVVESDACQTKINFPSVFCTTLAPRKEGQN